MATKKVGHNKWSKTQRTQLEMQKSLLSFLYNTLRIADLAPYCVDINMSSSKKGPKSHQHTRLLAQEMLWNIW